MSIISELENSKVHLRQARKAILGRGGEISATAGLKDLPNAIFNIPADASLAFQTDENVAYRKIVPVGAEEYAQIARIGGMTRKSVNLAANSTFTQISNGFSVNPQDDGTVEITGSATETLNISLHLALRTGTKFTDITPIDMLPNVTYSIRVTKDGEKISRFGNRIEYTDEEGGTVYGWNNQDITRPRQCASVYIQDTYEVGSTEPCGVYSVMVIEGDDEETLDNYQQYYKGLRDTKVLALESYGKNFAKSETTYTTTFGGLTIFRTKDSAKFMLNGTSTSNSNTKIGSNIHLPKGIYVASVYGLSSGDRIFIAYTDELGNQKVLQNYIKTGESKAFENDEDRDVYAQFVCIPNSIYNNTECGLQIERVSSLSDKATEFTDFIGTVDTLDIPEAVQSLDGYGRGVNADYYNYVEWRNGRAYFVQNTYRKVFDGTEKWQTLADVPNAEGDRLKRLIHVLSPVAYGLGNQKVSPFICNLYPETTAEQTYFGSTGCAINNSGQFFVFDLNYQTADAWKTHLAELYANGNPFVVEYALAEPIVTDITHLMQDNFIKVEGGGTIKFENEYNYDVPSTINYITKVGG